MAVRDLLHKYNLPRFDNYYRVIAHESSQPFNLPLNFISVVAMEGMMTNEFVILFGKQLPWTIHFGNLYLWVEPYDKLISIRAYPYYVEFPCYNGLVLGLRLSKDFYLTGPDIKLIPPVRHSEVSLIHRFASIMWVEDRAFIDAEITIDVKTNQIKVKDANGEKTIEITAWNLRAFLFFGIFDSLNR